MTLWETMETMKRSVVSRSSWEGRRDEQVKYRGFFLGQWNYSLWYCAAAAKSLQLCLTLCDPRDGSPPGSPVPGILQVGTLEWVAMSSSRGSFNPGTKPMSPVSPVLQADSLPSEPPGEAHSYVKREDFWEDSKKETFISAIVILWVSLVVQQ